jgi:hypothetical protein
MAAAFCYPQVARRIDVSPTLWDIRTYVYDALQIGQKRATALDKLEQVGRVSISRTINADGNYFEVVYLDICPSLWVGMTLHITYTSTEPYTVVQLIDASDS